MTDKDTAATVASEAVRAIRGMNALLKDYSGTALAHLYELQETETIRLIVGAQPLIPPFFNSTFIDSNTTLITRIMTVNNNVVSIFSIFVDANIRV